MTPVRTKICGITTPEDAAACLACGADYLGVIFAESPRRIEIDRALAIRQAIPGGRLVGVFCDEALAKVVRTALRSHLDLIQLHGSEPPRYVEELRATLRLPVIKAFRRNGSANLGTLAAYRAAGFFLLDLDKDEPDREAARRGLWERASAFAAAGRPVFLAGGLTPANVRAALVECAPFGVDVCSGVERSPGVKDLDAVARFIGEVRNGG